jgi:hypothetical protein
MESVYREMIEEIKRTLANHYYTFDKKSIRYGYINYLINIIKILEQNEFGESLSFYKILNKEEKDDNTIIEVESIKDFTYHISITNDGIVEMYRQFKDPIRLTRISLKLV